MPRRRERYSGLSTAVGATVAYPACAAYNAPSAPQGPPPVSVTSTHLERGTGVWHDRLRVALENGLLPNKPLEDAKRAAVRPPRMAAVTSRARERSLEE